jgi:hypothetical protein
MAKTLREQLIGTWCDELVLDGPPLAAALDPSSAERMIRS